MREQIGTVTLTKDEYVLESVRLWMDIHANKIRIHKFIGLGGICLGVLFRILSRRDLTQNGSVILMGLGALMLIIVALYPFEVRRNARKIADNPQNASYFEEVTLSVDEVGFEARDNKGINSFVPWSTLVKKRETGRVIYLYSSQIAFSTFPKHYPSQHLQELVQSRIEHLPTS